MQSIPFLKKTQCGVRCHDRHGQTFCYSNVRKSRKLSKTATEEEQILAREDEKDILQEGKMICAKAEKPPLQIERN